MILLHKGGNKNDFNNYGPIYKLPCLAKILESLVKEQLRLFLSETSMLTQNQSGFVAKHSTITDTTVVLNGYFGY